MGTVEAWFDGSVELRKGDIVRISKGILEDQRIRATEIENVTAGRRQKSRIAGTMMTVSPVEFGPPVTGVVELSDLRDKNTYFTLATGVYLESHRFLRDGSPREGHDALRAILSGDAGGYVKVVDPYTTPETLDLLASVREGTKVSVLCGAKAARAALRAKVETLRRSGLDIDVRVDRKEVFHDRFIVTGRGAWHVGHSLKDFGKKATYLSRMAEPQPLEDFFGECWDSADKL